MKNLRELFSLYHAGFQDFGPWLDHHREIHRRHPLDAPEFGAEWLRRWEAVGRLLNASGLVQARHRDGSLYVSVAQHWTIGQCLIKAIAHDANKPNNTYVRVAITLLDGTIIREWGPK